MSRGSYSAGKRERDTAKSRKKREKAQRRDRKRVEGRTEVPIADPEEVTGDLVAAERAAQAKFAASKGPRSIPCRLFVGSLSWDTNEDSLRQVFAKFGPVSDGVIVQDRDTGKSRGFGFITMENRKDATRAIDSLDGSDLDGRQLVVKVATERSR